MEARKRLRGRVPALAGVSLAGLLLAMAVVSGRSAASSTAPVAGPSPVPAPPPAPATPAAPASSAGLEDNVTQGALRVKVSDGTTVECPLRHTDIAAEISGFVARVKVVQTFENPFDEKIEAVYVFPLPHTAAVDDMTMVVGERRIVGVIKRRAEAREIYEQALLQGMTASLLEQERPNIFTQSVGNIAPGQEVRVEISYVDVLEYDMGTYEFHFPMVVGPRYIPGAPTGAQGTGWSPDTTRVPDASRITPAVLPPGHRTGHDVSLSVRLEAGVPIRDLRVESHQADVRRLGRSGATAALRRADSIPNKDFVLKYKVAGQKPEVAVIAHVRPGEDGYFLMMVQPKDVEEELRKAPPREVCFLIDVSGSMSGAPTAKVVETMRRFFERSKPEDRIQVVTFASTTQKLFDGYVAASPGNVGRALSFTDGLRGGGGTEMLSGVRAVLAEPVDPERVRIVIMLTDGYIGNEAEIIREVARRAGDHLRFWTVGIGSSPNRFLLDGIAKQGGGMSGVVGLEDDPTGLVERIVERIHRAQLARIQVDWGGHRVYETYPARIPELWAGRPVVLLGRYEPGGSGTVRLEGLVEGRPASFPVEVSLPASEPAHGVLARAWARRKIEDLSAQHVVGGEDALVEEITEIALAHHLVSAYTSFVAVDESERDSVLDAGRPPRRVAVPVPLPEGVRYEGIFGEWPIEDLRSFGSAAMALGVEGGIVGGVPGGVMGGVVGGLPSGVFSASVEAPPGGSGFPGVAAELAHKTRAPMATPPPAAARPPAAMPPPASQRSLADTLAVAGPRGQAGLHASTRHAQAVKALEQARALIARKDLSGAARRLQLAYLLASSSVHVAPGLDDGTLASIRAEWATLDKARAAAAAAGLPALGKRLDIVIRNADVEAALRAIAAASGLAVRVQPGSLDDARALTGTDRLRVAYLDLRHATAVQGLTWLVAPVGLEWQVRSGAVVVGSARRSPGSSAWVYDVGDLVRPAAAEAAGDAATGAKAIEADLADVEKAFRRVLRAEGGSPLAPPAALLLDAERLLVAGGRANQARAGALVDALRNPAADLRKAVELPVTPGDLRQIEALRARTAPRWAAHARARAQRLRKAALGRAASVAQELSWALLAAASRRAVDPEAVSELLEAWSTPGLATSLAGSYRPLLARSIWAVAEARTAAPDDPALEALADSVSRATTEVLARAPAASSSEEAAFVSALYLSLARSAPVGALPPPLRAALAGAAGSRSAGAPREELRSVASLLLSGRPGDGESRADADTIRKALEDGRLAGEDATVLAALALRRAGGEHWDAFRARKPEITRSAGLTGAALRLVNRLDRPALTALAGR